MSYSLRMDDPLYILGVDILAPFESLFNSVGSWISGAVNSISTFITDKLTWVYDNVKGGIDSLASAMGTVKDGIINFPTTISNAFSGALDVITKGLGSIATSVMDALSGFATQIVTGANVIAGKVIDGAKWIITEIGKGLTSFFTWVVDGVKSIRDDLASGKIGDAFLKILPVVAIGGGVSLGLTALGTKVMGSGVDITPLSNFLSKLLSPEIVTSALVSALVSAGITIPMSRYAMKQFRPVIPNINQAWQMWREDQISESDFDELVKQAGYDDKLIKPFKEVFNKDPDTRTAFVMWRMGLINDEAYSKLLFMNGWDEDYQEKITTFMFGALGLSELMRLADYFDLDDSFIVSNLKASGFSDEQVKYIAPLVKLRPLKDEYSAIADTYKNEYLLGDLDEEEYKKYLESVGYTSSESALRVETGKNLLTLNLLGLKKTMYMYQYEKDVFGTTEPDASQEYYKKLIDCGLRNTVANWTVNIERAKKGLPDIEFEPT